MAGKDLKRKDKLKAESDLVFSPDSLCNDAGNIEDGRVRETRGGSVKWIEQTY